MIESDRFLNRRIGEAERFLFDNWVGYGKEFNFENVLPVVMIEKKSDGKYFLTPVFKTESVPLVVSNIYGKGVGYNSGHFTVIGDPVNLALYSDDLDLNRWSSDFTNPAGIARPQLENSKLDLYNLYIKNPPYFKARFFNFGQIVDKKYESKSQFMLVGFTEENEKLAKLQAMEWMANMSNRKFASLNNLKSVGRLVSPTSGY